MLDGLSSMSEDLYSYDKDTGFRLLSNLEHKLPMLKNKHMYCTYCIIFIQYSTGPLRSVVYVQYVHVSAAYESVLLTSSTVEVVER